MFTLRCKQSDIVPIICHQYRWYCWCTLTCEYLRDFPTKFKMTLMLFSGDWGKWVKMIHEKSWSKKSRDTVPLRWHFFKWYFLQWVLFIERYFFLPSSITFDQRISNPAKSSILNDAWVPGIPQIPENPIRIEWEGGGSDHQSWLKSPQFQQQFVLCTVWWWGIFPNIRSWSPRTILLGGIGWKPETVSCINHSKIRCCEE